MLANRAKVLANLKPYHKDVFAFDFTRALLAHSKVFVPYYYRYGLNCLHKNMLLFYMYEKLLDDAILPQIGWLLVAFYKIQIRVYQTGLLDPHRNFGPVIVEKIADVKFTNIRNKTIKELPSVEYHIQDLLKVVLDLINSYKPGTMSQSNIRLYIQRFYSLKKTQLVVPHFYLPISEYTQSLGDNVDVGYKSLLMEFYKDVDFTELYAKFKPLLDDIIPDLNAGYFAAPRFNRSFLAVIHKLKSKCKVTPELLLKSMLNLDEVLDIFMFADYFERGSMSFNKYEVEDYMKVYDENYGRGEILVTAEEFQKIKFTTIPFDTTKSFCEVIAPVIDVYYKRDKFVFNPVAITLAKKQLHEFIQSSCDSSTFHPGPVLGYSSEGLHPSFQVI